MQSQSEEECRWQVRIKGQQLEVQQILQQQRENILRMSESLAAHSVMASAHQRLHQIRQSPLQSASTSAIQTPQAQYLGRQQSTSYQNPLNSIYLKSPQNESINQPFFSPLSPQQPLSPYSYSHLSGQTTSLQNFSQSLRPNTSLIENKSQHQEGSLIGNKTQPIIEKQDMTQVAETRKEPLRQRAKVEDFNQIKSPVSSENRIKKAVTSPSSNLPSNRLSSKGSFSSTNLDKRPRSPYNENEQAVISASKTNNSSFKETEKKMPQKTKSGNLVRSVRSKNIQNLRESPSVRHDTAAEVFERVRKVISPQPYSSQTARERLFSHEDGQRKVNELLPYNSEESAAIVNRLNAITPEPTVQKIFTEEDELESRNDPVSAQVQALHSKYHSGHISEKIWPTQKMKLKQKAPAKKEESKAKIKADYMNFSKDYFRKNAKGVKKGKKREKLLTEGGEQSKVQKDKSSPKVPNYLKPTESFKQSKTDFKFLKQEYELAMAAHNAPRINSAKAKSSKVIAGESTFKYKYEDGRKSPFQRKTILSKRKSTANIQNRDLQHNFLKNNRTELRRDYMSPKERSISEEGSRQGRIKSESEIIMEEEKKNPPIPQEMPHHDGLILYQPFKKTLSSRNYFSSKRGSERGDKHSKSRGHSQHSQCSYQSNRLPVKTESVNTSTSIKKKNKDLYDYSQDVKKREKVPSFGGTRLADTPNPGKYNEGEYQKNSFATLTFINRPGATQKSPGFGSIITKHTPQTKPVETRFDVSKFKREQQVFSGGEQDNSFSFDLGNLEDKIYNTDAGRLDKSSKEGDEDENEEIKKILGSVSVSGQAPAGPQSCNFRSISMIQNESRKNMLNESNRGDSSVDFVTRESEIQEEMKKGEQAKNNSQSSSFNRKQFGRENMSLMERRLTVEDVYLLTDPRSKSVTLDLGDYESALKELRSRTPKPEKRHLGPDFESHIPRIRTASTTPTSGNLGVKVGWLKEGEKKERKGRQNG